MNTLDNQYIRHPNLFLLIILVVYFISGSLFARLTPTWQNPDEPAHYNYIAYLAHEGQLPVLQMGDFDMEYIGQIVGARFSPELSVEPLRYEFYQPPLYYLSAVPVYLLAGGMSDGQPDLAYGQALTAIRFYSLLLGLGTLVLLYTCLRIAFPQRPLIGLGATAFAATLPMHVAMTASANNDSLAILLLMAASLMLLRWMRKTLNPHTDAQGADAAQQWYRWQLATLGLLLGLGLLTKIYAYAFLPVCGLMILLISWKRGGLRTAIINALWMVVPALLLGLPLWLRNISLYGLMDPLGLTWHDAVVVGQATTEGWIAQHGWSAYWERAFGFTFRSFWGVFGWLGLFWDWRLYTVVRVLSLITTAGLLLAVASSLRNWRADESQFKPLAGWVTFLLSATFVMVVISYGFYNLKFVQHQGRYFFWGLLPITAAFALGWRQLMRPGSALVAAFVIMASAAYVVLLGDRNLWSLLIHAAAIGLLLLQALLSIVATVADNSEKDNQEHSDSQTDNVLGRLGLVPPALRSFSQRVFSQRGPLPAIATRVLPLMWAAPFLLMFGLCIVSVFIYVVPQLSY